MPSRAIPYVKALVHVVCLWPFLYLLYLYRSGQLATYADPTNFITHFTGDWALWLLLATLTVTPLRKIHRSLSWLIRLRRLIGLYAFFYATLHVSTYVFLFSGYDMASAIAGVRAGHFDEPLRQVKLIWPTMVDDAEKRKFIQVGLLAWLILLALALTSSRSALLTLGGRWWQGIHRLIYVAGIAAVVHYWWLVKTGVRTPWKDTAVLAVLLLWRVGLWLTKKASARQPAVVAAPVEVEVEEHF